MTNINKFIIIYSFLLIFNNHTMIYRKQNSIENIIQKKIIDLGSSIHKKLASGGESLQRFFINTKENLVDSLSNLWKNHKWAIGGGTSLAAIIGFLVYNNKNKTTKKQKKINIKQPDNTIYLSDNYLNNIEDFRIINTTQILEESEKKQKLIDEMNTMYAPIKFAIKNAEKNNTDQTFDDIILAMIAIHDLMKLIVTECSKSKEQITEINFFTLYFYFDIIKMIEGEITKKIEGVNAHAQNESTLIKQIKEKFWYLSPNPNTVINSYDFLNNENIEIPMDQVISMPHKTKKDVDAASFVSFFTNNKIYKKIKTQDKEQSNISRTQHEYNKYNKQIVDNLNKSEHLSNLITTIKNNHEDWINEMSLNINQVRDEIPFEMERTREA